jgi:hypothetical protein
MSSSQRDTASHLLERPGRGWEDNDRFPVVFAHDGHNGVRAGD